MQDAINSAFRTWANTNTNLSFTQVNANQNPDILIEWRPQADPDLSMAGDTIAHADFPPGHWIITTQLPLPLHFDDSETWAIGGYIDIESVALHEIGHCLGLLHSEDHQEAVMFPSYQGIRRSLSADDILGVRSLYRITGIGGYDLASEVDRVIAFDYQHSGRLDHLVLYRPGEGSIFTVEHAGAEFHPVYAQHGIGGYDLRSQADRVIAFDYNHNHSLDHLVLYRPGE